MNFFIANAGTTYTECYLHIAIALFNGCDICWGEIFGVPEDVEVSVGGSRIGSSVVYGEGEDEVEIYSRVDWDIGELDALELCTYVLSKDVGGLR